MTLTHDEYRDSRYFRGLDGVRALSAIAVIVHHTSSYWKRLHGADGVTVFFALSGFLITTLILREVADRGRLSLLAFYVRRSFRIFPPYYLLVATYGVLIFGLGGDAYVTKRGDFTTLLPYYLFYMNDFVPEGPVNVFYHGWSLGIEEKFYLIWPALGFVLLAGAKWIRIALALVIVAIPQIVLPFYQEFYHIQAFRTLMCGCLLAHLLQSPRTYAWLRWLGTRAGTAASLSLFALYHFMRASLPMADLVYPLAITLVIAGLVTGPGRLVDLLDTRPLRYLGKISYGMYLVQLLAISLTVRVLRSFEIELYASNSPGDELFAVVLSVGISAAIASVIYYLVERPAKRFGHRWSKEILDRTSRS